MSDLAAYLAAAILLGFSVYRLSTDRPSTDRPSTDRRGAPNHAQRYGYCLMICLALAMAMLAPSMPDLLAALALKPAAVILLGDTVRTAAMSALMFMAYAVRRRPVRGLPVPAAVGVQFVRLGLFLAAHPAIGSDDTMVTHGTGRWLYAAYDALFAAYAAWSLAAAVRAFGDEARRAGPGPVRAGIRLSLAALAVGMAWTTWTIDDVVHVLRTGIQDGSEDLVSNTLGALCAALIVAAAVVAKWHAAYSAARDRIQAYRTYRRLTPLWEAMHAELPQIALDDDRRVLLSDRSLDFALYRRVIEIHDGRLALRPYTPDDVPDAVGSGRLEARAGARGPAARREAHIEAATIAVALENHRAGRIPAADDSAEGSAHRSARHVEAVETVTAEAAWLADVAVAFARIRKHPEHVS